MTSLVDRLLPDALWQRIQPLLPAPPPRSRGGVPRRVPDRNCLAAVIFMARTSTPWSLLPAKELGCGSAGRIDLERVSVDSFSLRAVEGET
jgi:hypothetical protein